MGVRGLWAGGGEQCFASVPVVVLSHAHVILLKSTYNQLACNKRITNCTCTQFMKPYGIHDSDGEDSAEEEGGAVEEQENKGEGGAAGDGDNSDGDSDAKCDAEGGGGGGKKRKGEQGEKKKKRDEEDLELGLLK